MFNKIAIVGVGLMGGSIGKAVRNRHLAKEVIGVLRREISKHNALKYKACDRATLSLKKGVHDADLVIVALPVGKIAEKVLESAKYMKEGSIITDVGSAKKHVVEKIEKHINKTTSFISSHPMAGSDRTGVLNADSEIFKNAPLIMTKTKNTDIKALIRLKKFWGSLGCRTFVLSPGEHDKVMSFASYLPHVVSFALALSQTKNSVKFGAGSLKDTTRVASSDPEIWRDIFLAAGPDVLKSIGVFSQNLQMLQRAIAKKDGKMIKKFLNRAKEIRDSIS